MARVSGQVILSRALTPEERQRLREQNNPYRLSSMTWSEWGEAIISSAKLNMLCGKDSSSPSATSNSVASRKIG
eukprot:Skav213885  [mRNA]  locus=scaffold2374:242943:243878:- [translate_table: standard]